MTYKKLIKYGFVCVCTFILFEFILFFSGRFLLFQKRKPFQVQGAIQIVCAGDSHTFGVGTSALYSYPKQLETLLNMNNPKKKFTVINLGIPGSSTKRQIQEIDSYLRKNHVEAVLLLTGRNNQDEVKMFNKPSFFDKINFRIHNVKSLRFMEIVFSYLLGIRRGDAPQLDSRNRLFNSYLNAYLNEARRLCFVKNAKLILLSYYNSSDATVKAFAVRYGLIYLELMSDFEVLFKTQDRIRYLSPDMSHMNFRGYKFFAEEVYNKLFLRQEALGLKLNPLLMHIADDKFYSNRDETGKLILLQQERLMRHKDSWEYPFEMIHLGHIYMESGNEEAARACYLQGLRISNYADNNTLVAPIINWFLAKNERDRARQICEEILSHNPQNTIVLYYRNWLYELPHPASILQPELIQELKKTSEGKLTSP